MIHRDDPRLTAFALGECAEWDDAERQEIESAVQASAELQREVAAIRENASWLQESLGGEACPGLTDAQRAAIEAAADAAATVQLPSRIAASTRPSWRRPLTLAVAVGLLVVVSGVVMVNLDFDRLTQPSVAFRSEVARKTPAAADSASEYVPLPAAYAGRAAEDESGIANPYRRSGDGGQRMKNDTVRFGLEAGRPAADLDLQGIEERTGEAIRSGLVQESEPRSGEQSLMQEMREVEEERPSGVVDHELSVERRVATPAEVRQQSDDFFAPLASVDSAVAGEPAPGKSSFEVAAPEKPASLFQSSARGEGKSLNAGANTTTEQRPSVNISDGAESTTSPVNADAKRPAQPADVLRRIDLSRENSVRVRERIIDEKLPGLQDKQEGRFASGPQGRTLAGDGAQPPVDNLSFVGDAREASLQQTNEELSKQLTAAKREKKANTWRRARATPNASQLMIGDQDGLPLEGMQVNVMVDGFRARVLLDLYYYNDRGNRLEGNFKLRLPNEASLYYFAFGQSAYEYRPMVDQLASKGFLTGDLIRAASLEPSGILRAREGSWTDVKEARVVPREKAARAYSETVRRRVDPALVEWSGAGVFNARVFPLMPGKLHRVVVGYDVDLQQQGGDWVYALDLPDDQGECMVDLNVSALPGVTAEVTPQARPFISSGRACYNFTDPADSAITVRLKNVGSMLLTGTDEGAGEFFASRITPDLPGDEVGASSPRAVFLVDTSLSSQPEKFNLWLDMLRAVLTENRDSIDAFAVLFFNIESHWWHDGFRKNTSENVDQLAAYCQTLSLEGATDLQQALHEATSPLWAPENALDRGLRPDLFLLSDGAVTWGESNLHRLSQTLQEADSGPLFAYQTGLTGTATGMLEHLARESGGAVFSVIDAQEIPQAARAHRQRPWQLLDVTLPGGSDVLVAGRPRFIYPGQSLMIVGRGQPDPEVTLRVRQGDQQRAVDMKVERTVASALVPRIYGQVSVGQLEDLGNQMEDVAIAYARHFRVTGQTCSLLMLESEADYQRFDIKPEEDALLVRTSPSAELITAKLDELGEQLGDAKAQLTAWLSKLERTPGVQFKMPTALRLALDRLPREAFDVDQARLVCARRTNDDPSAEFLRRRESDRLDYMAVTNLAASRGEQHGAADALRTLSCLIENNPGDPVLARDVAFSALEWGLSGQAFQLFRHVADLRPYEPQSYQAMSLCLAETGNADLAMVFYEVALNATWHARYLDIKQIVAVEYLDLLRRIEREELPCHARDYAVARLASLHGRAPVGQADLVVTMMWNTDRTDVDLHVIEPTGEECYFEHPRTRIGGRITRDVTEGFGPEMYWLGEAKAGEYRVLAKYYGSDANRTNVRSKVYVTVYRNYGDPARQWIEKKTVTLADHKEKRELLTLKVKP